jgi:diguanylate cyclase (GGDEF)-like protein
VKLRRAMPYDAIAIYVRHGDELVPEYVNGDNFRLFASLRIPMGQGLSGWVAQNLKPILNGNPSVEPGYLNDASKYSTLNAALAVPLEGLQGVVGVVALYHAEKDFFTFDHLRILLAVSSKMALAIENAMKYEQAESSAVTDYLTGLPNARSLFLQLDRELARCKRDDKTLTVMIADLDGFKQINDRFGHLEGNRVLRLFAHSLKETSREYDYVARMGGDEFVVIAPGLTAEAAARKAEQMRDLAQQAGREICNEDILSLSVGKAVYPQDGIDAEKILSEADKRMYLQKRSQASPKNRRLYPRTRGRLTAEIVGRRPENLTWHCDQPEPGRLLYRDQRPLVAGIEVATYFLARTYERHDSKRGGAARHGDRRGDEVSGSDARGARRLAAHPGAIGRFGSRGRPQARSSRGCAHSVKEVLYRIRRGSRPAELRWAESGADESGSVGRCCPMCCGVLTAPAAAYSPWALRSGRTIFRNRRSMGRACSLPYKPIQDSACNC